MLIESLIADITGRIPPSAGDNLTGFVIDAEYFLDNSEAFESVHIERSKNLDSLLEIHAEVAASISSVQEIHHRLLGAWQSIAYSNFEASAVHYYREATVFRFVTVISHDAFYVSGMIRVAGPHYPTLVQRYNRNLGASLGSLPNRNA